MPRTYLSLYVLALIAMLAATAEAQSPPQSRTFALQPVSLEGSVALGVSALKLRPMP
jgi:hypothetical protein